MYSYRLLFLCVCYIIEYVRSDLPPYITPCNFKDPNWNDCCLEKGKIALKELIKGDRKYNIPPLNPLKLPVVDVDGGKDLKIKLTDLAVYGFENTELKKTLIDLNSKSGQIDLFFPELQLIGKYKVDGKILVLPLTGNGPINITGVDGRYTYKFNYELINKDGKQYANLLDNDSIDLSHKQIYFKLDNLFNGDEQLGAHTNKFLNENWAQVIDEIGAPIKQTISVIARTTAGNVFNKVPYNELFLNE